MSEFSNLLIAPQRNLTKDEVYIFPPITTLYSNFIFWAKPTIKNRLRK
jgi:hypothetical protein